MNSGLDYDAAGNVLSDTQSDNGYLCDAEGRLCSVYNGAVGGYTKYFYDAEGRLAGSMATSGLTCLGPTSAPPGNISWGWAESR